MGQFGLSSRPALRIILVIPPFSTSPSLNSVVFFFSPLVAIYPEADFALRRPSFMTPI